MKVFYKQTNKGFSCHAAPAEQNHIALEEAAAAVAGYTR